MIPVMQEILVVFDIDGTLTRTTGVDGECYVQALSECFGIDDIDTDWSHYRHTSDSGIMAEIFEQRFGRLPSDQERALATSRLVELLEEHWRHSPLAFSAVPGAPELIRRFQHHGLRQHGQGHRWYAAMATGACRPSALFKLEKAGIDSRSVALASSEDGPSRERIVRTAIRQAAEAVPGSAHRIVSVGDGVWDVRTARRLGLPFVGIASEQTRERLAAEGAQSMLADYSDPDAALRTFAEASVPGEPT